jgi:hypothetical protein
MLPVSGGIQVWCKWTAASLGLDGLPTVKIRKSRNLRGFETAGETVREIPLGRDGMPLVTADAYPASGCMVELTLVRVGDDPAVWWTFGCEAFGSLASVEQSLRRTIGHLSLGGMPGMETGSELSYPAWISGLER